MPCVLLLLDPIECYNLFSGVKLSIKSFYLFYFKIGHCTGKAGGRGGGRAK